MPIDGKVAYGLLREFGVYYTNASDARLNPFLGYHVRTVDAIARALADVKQVIESFGVRAPAVGVFDGNRLRVVKKVLEYINEQGADLAKAQAQVADMHLLRIGLNLDWPAMNAAPWALKLRTAWPNLTADQRAGIAAFAQKRNHLTAVERVLEFAAVAPLTELQNFQIFGDIAYTVNGTRHDDQKFNGLTPAAFPALRTLYGLHPPRSDFAGFTRWGPGNHDTATWNLRWHFLKHVCAQTEGDEITYWGEFRDWWHALNISLPLATVTPLLSGGQTTAAVAAWFTAPNGALAENRVEAFLRTDFLTANPRVLGYLVSTYETAYSDYAIDASANLDENVVQSDGQDVFVAGIRGDLFIVGRLDNGTLGLSSAYFTPSGTTKMAGSRANKQWNLH